MKIDVTVKDLLKIMIVMMAMICFLAYKSIRHDAAIKLARITNTIEIFGQNFNAIQNWKEQIEGRLQRTELAMQIQGNIVETGELDDKGNPVKK